MYPDFHYLLQSLFGIDFPAIGLLKTFGFFVALAFIIAGYVLSKELKRKAALGYFQPSTKKEIVGQAPTIKDWIGSAIIGFILGFKVIGLFQNHEAASGDPLAFVMSLQGSWIGGLIVGAIMGYLKYSEQKKQQLPRPKEQTYVLFPHNRLMDIIFISAAAGFIGAKVFNAFETWDYFIQDPLGSLFSSGGFTFYGGLICATAALYIYAKKHNFSFAQLCDAAAPALMIAYAVGRLGCHFSGDGDWGIYNSAYLSTPEAKLVEQVDDKAFYQLVQDQPALFTEFKEFATVPNAYFNAPEFLPRWMVAMNYAHNVNNEGFEIAGDTGNYNHALPAGVFPTPIYEFIVCTLLFFILMGLRKRFTVPLRLFGVYLIFNGLERFLVEKIRVNTKVDLGFIHPTQAEIISTILIIIGIYLLVRKASPAPKVYTPSNTNL